MNTVTKLRPGTPARTPERDALAAAVARHGAAVARCAAFLAALDDWQSRTAARDKVARAEAAVEEAKQAAASFIVASALGEAGSAPLSIKEARAMLQDARDELEAIESAKAALTVQAKEAERELGHARHALDFRIAEVVKASPLIGQLLSRFEAAQREVAALHEEIAAVNLFLPPDARNWDCSRAYPKSGTGERWRAALKALETDADAQLPGEIASQNVA